MWLEAYETSGTWLSGNNYLESRVEIILSVNEAV